MDQRLPGLSGVSPFQGYSYLFTARRAHPSIPVFLSPDPPASVALEQGFRSEGDDQEREEDPKRMQWRFQLTHRYHQRDFLLNFARDRRRWRRWPFRAKMDAGMQSPRECPAN
jgi:hypothetical protein